MEQKPVIVYNGKALYNPRGKAAEYSKWACNFYTGCSNGCTYCYLKDGRSAKVLGGDKPQLKKCFKNEAHALEIFERELNRNLIWEKTERITNGLKENGLFFTFTSDPMLNETIDLTINAIDLCQKLLIPVKILTKSVSNIHALHHNNWSQWRIAVGFTLTGHDELEPNASTNQDRMESMYVLKQFGYKIFASIEPIIDFEASELMIAKTKNFCDHYKIGLKSGSKHSPEEIIKFMNKVNFHLSFSENNKIPTVYWKNSLLKMAKVTREELPSNCVDQDYNIFQ